MTPDSFPSHEGTNQEADNCLAYRVETPNESKFYHGQIMRWVRHLAPATILLAGEKRDVAPIISNEVGASLVETAGLVDADHIWDFNEDRPDSLVMAQYDVVVSQAILEHILNPYGFLCNLALLANMGHVLIHTHIPGFPHHVGDTFPVDCLRYFPDWFDAVAPLLDLQVVEITEDAAHLFVHYRRRM